MPKKHQPRSGSLQFWPRKRAVKLLPSVNWPALQKKKGESEKGLLGFVGYKAGMARCLVRDLTADSLTKNKQIILPLTFIECPPLKVLAVRFYKDNRVVLDIFAENLDKELKHKLKLPKESRKKIEDIEKKLDEFDDIRFIAYSIVKRTGLKKTPDIAEIGLSGSLADKFRFVKENLSKEINIENVFNKGEFLDVRGITKGHGFTGPVKRFGISLKQKKSEKGQRRPGSLGPWTPSRVTFRAPLAGQHGFFNRIHYNTHVLEIGTGKNLALEFLHYGKIRTNYLAVKGSVEGPAKRQLLLSAPLRMTKKISKEKFELLSLLK